MPLKSNFDTKIHDDMGAIRFHMWEEQNGATITVKVSGEALQDLSPGSSPSATFWEFFAEITDAASRKYDKSPPTAGETLLVTKADLAV
jgi:hypothetical protein